MTANPPVPSVSFARLGAACHLYAHSNGEEMLLLDLPGDGSFTVGSTSTVAAANPSSRGWLPGSSDVEAGLRAIVARELDKPREKPSRVLARIRADMGLPSSN